MNTFTLDRCHRVWVLFTISLLILGLTIEAQYSSSSSSSGSSISISPSDSLPCMHQGQFILHGKTEKMNRENVCLFCTCDNSTLSCQFNYCSPMTCSKPMTFEGICCKACPYNVTVNDVVLTVPSDTSIKSGSENEISLDLGVLYALNSDATGIAGRNLWTTRLWVSRFADGSDELSGTVVEEALTEEQQSLSLRKNPTTRTFSIDDIRYRFDLTHHTCKDAKYICAQFNKGQNPEPERDYLDFHFQAKPTNDVLIDCIEVTDCRRPSDSLPCMNQGKLILHGQTERTNSCSFCTCDNSTLSCQFETCRPLTCRKPIRFEGICCGSCPYNVTVNDVVLTVPADTSIKSGSENEISLDLGVLYAFNSDATGIAGRSLWTTRLWVSRFADGSDELSGTVVEEALTEEQQSLSLRKNPTTRTFSIDDIRYRFDLTHHTCKDAKYICAQFNKGQNPEPERDYLDFHFQAKPTNDVLIDCIEAGPFSMIEVTDCRHEPPMPIVKDIQLLIDSKTVVGEVGVNDISLSLDVSYSPGKISLSASMWLSNDRFGSAVLFGTQVDDVLSVTLIQPQEFVKHPTDGHFTINGIRYSVDLSGHTCGEAKYVCAQLSETTNEMEGTSGAYIWLEGSGGPNESAVTGCAEIPKCLKNNLI